MELTKLKKTTETATLREEYEAGGYKVSAEISVVGSVIKNIQMVAVPVDQPEAITTGTNEMELRITPNRFEADWMPATDQLSYHFTFASTPDEVKVAVMGVFNAVLEAIKSSVGGV